MHLTIVDIIILICFIPAIIIGISKGLVRQLAGIAALILGVYSSYKFSGLVSEKIQPWIDATPTVISLLSFSITFFGVLIIVILIGRAAEGIIKITMLSWVDKVLGVVFAIIKTAFIISLIIYVLNSLNELWHFLPNEKFSDSKIYSTISDIAPKIFPYLKNL